MYPRIKTEPKLPASNELRPSPPFFELFSWIITDDKAPRSRNIRKFIELNIINKNLGDRFMQDFTIYY